MPHWGWIALTEEVNKVKLRGYGFEKQSWFGHVCVKKNRDFLKGLRNDEEDLST
jgi:hypothetical protein